MTGRRGVGQAWPAGFYMADYPRLYIVWIRRLGVDPRHWEPFPQRTFDSEWEGLAWARTRYQTEEGCEFVVLPKGMRPMRRLS